MAYSHIKRPRQAQRIKDSLGHSTYSAIEVIEPVEIFLNFVKTSAKNKTYRKSDMLLRPRQELNLRAREGLG
ncbi:MAG: hypothetical protein QT05_C0047G0003 [archaeon GW2011_AR13]|nr:MAG: hypothetical protein QT05_C0047G0003 [archaeon GW2011_AR13]